MNSDRPSINENTPAWMAFVWISFAVSVGLMCLGIYHLPVDAWIKGYMIMGMFFTVGSTFTLSKTVRDNHEAKKLINKISEVKAERLIQDYELKEPVAFRKG
jgi:hypothetical protein